MIVAGLAGNYFKFSIFFNIDFIFGSIFAMLALQFLGLGRGILAAIMIASYTYILWNHPYAIIIMTAEVAAVGWLIGRRKIGLVLADSLYWLFIGMPLVYLFYNVVMHVPLSNTNIIMYKQAVNGIANALIARLIFTGYLLWLRSSPQVSYREIIYNLLISFVLFPGLAMLAISSRTDFAESDRQVRASLLRDSGQLKLRLETWVFNRKTAILTLAGMAAARSPKQMQPYLKMAKQSDVNFDLICLQDKNATTVAVFPLINELDQNNIGKNFADRQYLPQLKQSLKPMLSEVVMSRFGAPKPIVAMIAPVLMAGEYGGYVFGSLKLLQLQEHLDKSAEEHAFLYSLLDKNGTVFMTNRTDQKIMTPFSHGKGTFTGIQKGISQWMPALPANVPPTERWGKSYYVTDTSIGNLAEWRLILCQPVAPFQKHLNEKYADKLILLILVLFAALALAALFSRGLVVTLGRLNLLTSELPNRLTNDDKETTWPKSGIEEASHLIDNFRVMADSLSEKFVEIKLINESLEERIEARTNDLQQSRDQWKYTFDSMPDMITILDLNHHILHSNKAMLAAITPYQTGCHQDKHCYKVIHGLDKAPDWCPHSLLMIDGLQHQKQLFEPRLNKHLLVTATPIHNPSGDLIGSIHVASDITERVSFEEELATLVQEVETRNSFVESVISNLQSGIIVVDIDYRVKMVNAHVVELCQQTKEHFIGRNLADVSPELYEDVMAGKTAAERLASFGTVQLIIGYTCVNLNDTFQNIVGYIINFKDMTEIVRIREELRQKERLSAMGEVVARVAHEMRNPLFGMTAAAQILEMELSLDTMQQELMNSLLKESRRLNNLVEELLHTTRETKISKQRVNLISVIDISVQLVEAMLNEQKISLNKDYYGEVWLSADLEKLEQVLLNLIKNAMEATGTGGFINVAVASDDSYVSVIVTDNGEGILPENINRIFEVFYTTKKNGTGMGLSICRNIVEAHGGSLNASNNPDGGARFIMQLPLGESLL